MNNRAITFSSDENYINYVNALVGTLKHNNTTGDIIGRFVDTDEISVDDVQCIKVFDNQKLSNKKSILKDDTASIYYHYGIGRNNVRDLINLMYSERSVYTCHSRFKTIVELLDEGYEQILCLDVDTIVNKNINSIFNEIEDNDIMTIITHVDPGDVIEYHGNSKYTNNMNKTMRCMFNEGMIVINNTDRCRSFFKDVRDYIFTNDNWKEWNVDSKILNKLLNDKYVDIKIKECDNMYKNSECDPDALMWSGESITKNNPLFKQCVDKFNNHL